MMLLEALVCMVPAHVRRAFRRERWIRGAVYRGMTRGQAGRAYDCLVKREKP